MRVPTVSLGLPLILSIATLCSADSTSTILDVWPGKAPGEVGTVGEEKAKTETLPDGTTVTTSLTKLHIYASGGHGFGMRPIGKPVATWPKRCEEWLCATGIIKADGGR